MPKQYEYRFEVISCAPEEIATEINEITLAEGSKWRIKSMTNQTGDYEILFEREYGDD